MAHRHGKAGRYGKDESTQRLQQMMGRILMLAAVTFTLLGLMIGYFLGYGVSWWGVALVLVTFFAFRYAVRVLDPYIEAQAKERIKYLKGAQLEAVVAWVLEDLDDKWHVFNSIKLESQYDLDHVLIGPGGLYCISTKSNTGHYVGTPDGLLHNGQPCDFAKQAMRQAMNLKDRLSAIMGDGVPFIQPVLALPIGYTEGNACGGKVWLVHQWDIVKRLAPDPPRGKQLTAPDIERTVKALEMLETRAADVYKRPAIV